MTFHSDAAVAVDIVPSPNFGERIDVAGPDILLLHYTGMQSGEAALARLCSAESGVSAHYVVFEDGRIVQCVPEAARAWHAGQGAWRGAHDINSRSIGIEIVNPGHEFGYVAFPERQIAAVIALCRDILRRRPEIAPTEVLAHSDIAPNRKIDPGEKFPWRALHAAGVGHWVPPVRLSLRGPRLAAKDSGPAVASWQAALSAYGYGLAETGVFDADTAAVTRAFQRHFRPARVDGVADASTRATLLQLSKAVTETA